MVVRWWVVVASGGSGWSWLVVIGCGFFFFFFFFLSMVGCGPCDWYNGRREGGGGYGCS